jgi:hypothetical protein
MQAIYLACIAVVLFAPSIFAACSAQQKWLSSSITHAGILYILISWAT